jgi:hypothetical protein
VVLLLKEVSCDSFLALDEVDAELLPGDTVIDED